VTGIVVTGIGWFTAQGPGQGRTSRDFSMTSDPPPLVQRSDVFPEPNLRFGRLPQYSRMGLAAIAFALRDAGIAEWETKRPAGIVASTRAGCLAPDIEYYNTVLPEGGGLPSPNLFSSTLPTCFLGEAAIQFGLTGPTLAVNDPADDALGGVRIALETLFLGEAGTMLAGHIDHPPEPAFPGIRLRHAGCAFLVLENSRSPAVPGYGSIDLSEEGAVRHNGIAIADLNALVRACLSFPAADGSCSISQFPASRPL
jgi:3-oxoacyl-[acyl-carrier-protein] synthase II